MYCKNCGEQIDENAAICDKCGVAVNSAPKEKENEEGEESIVKALVEKHRQEIRTVKKMKIAEGFLFLLLSALLLFLPLFECQRPILSLTENEIAELVGVEDAEAFLRGGGYIRQTYSLFDEFKAGLFADEPGMETVMTFFVGLGILLLVLYFGGFLRFCYKTFCELKEIDQTAFAEIKQLRELGRKKRNYDFYTQNWGYMWIFLQFIGVAVVRLMNEKITALFANGNWFPLGTRSFFLSGANSSLLGLVLMVLGFGPWLLVVGKISQKEKDLLYQFTRQTE